MPADEDLVESPAVGDDASRRRGDDEDRQIVVPKTEILQPSNFEFPCETILKEEPDGSLEIDQDDQIESDLSDSSDDEDNDTRFGTSTIVKPEFHEEREEDGCEEGTMFELDIPGVSCIETKPRTYICMHCSYSSHHLGHVKRHVMSIHDKVRFPCRLCDHQSTTIYHLKRHMQLKHEEVTFACDVCKFTSKKRESFKKHYFKVHGRSPKNLSKYRQLPENTETETKLCDRCDYMTTDKEDLKHHMKEEHNQHTEITLANEEYKSGGVFLKDHMSIPNITENNDGRFHCQMCEYSASLRGSVTRHFRNVHQGLRFPCDLCDYQATRSHHLKRHKQRVHVHIVDL